MLDILNVFDEFDNYDDFGLKSSASALLKTEYILLLYHPNIRSRSLKPFELVMEDDYLACGPSEFNPSSCVICLKRVKDDTHVCPQCNIPVCQLEVSRLPWNFQ